MQNTLRNIEETVAPRRATALFKSSDGHLRLRLWACAQGDTSAVLATVKQCAVYLDPACCAKSSSLFEAATAIETEGFSDTEELDLRKHLQALIKGTCTTGFLQARAAVQNIQSSISISPIPGHIALRSDIWGLLLSMQVPVLFTMTKTQTRQACTNLRWLGLVLRSLKRATDSPV